MSDRFLRTLRNLATCYQAFAAHSSVHVRTLDLTPPQFDVLATLGNQPGMTCRELGERTLITKGTLTGVLDRMEARGLLTREPLEADRRSVYVRLTPAGASLFDAVFPEHLRHLRAGFRGFSDADLRQLDDLLQRLATGFAPNGTGRPDDRSSPKIRMIAAARRAS